MFLASFPSSVPFALGMQRCYVLERYAWVTAIYAAFIVRNCGIPQAVAASALYGESHILFPARRR